MTDMYAMYPAEWAEPDPEYPAPTPESQPAEYEGCNEICAEVAALKATDFAQEEFYRDWIVKNFTNHHIDAEQESKQ